MTQRTETDTQPERHHVTFVSGGETCAAWLYPGTNGACVVMAAGFGGIKELVAEPLAPAFVRAGYSVLAFDYRRLGESEGVPRQLIRVRDQLADWDAALAFAGTLPEVDPTRLAIWGMSASGGHVFVVAARHPELAAAIAHAPLADGIAATPNAAAGMTVRAVAGLYAAALRDGYRAMRGRPPVLLPLTGPRGTVASLTTEDSQQGPTALNPGNRHPWREEAAARSCVTLGFYRPGRRAPGIKVPLLVVAQEDDHVAPPGPAKRVARRAPRGELLALPGGHYGAFLDDRDAAIGGTLAFLALHVACSGDGTRQGSSGPPLAVRGARA